MKLVVGLGNPGRKYEQTRHNIGYDVAAYIATGWGSPKWRRQFSGETCDGAEGGTKICLLCPHTYMNASGRSVRRAVDFYKIPLEDVLVICDDLNLPLGKLRLRGRGSAGGQKGLADIIQALGDERFPRLRIGIGEPPQGWAVPDFVLSKFTAAERRTMDETVVVAAHAVADWAEHGIEYCMNRYN